MRDSREIQGVVHARLHVKDGTAGQHPPLTCHSYNLNTIVWETLALLGEWQLIELEPLPSRSGAEVRPEGR